MRSFFGNLFGLCFGILMTAMVMKSFILAWWLGVIILIVLGAVSCFVWLIVDGVEAARLDAYDKSLSEWERVKGIGL